MANWYFIVCLASGIPHALGTEHYKVEEIEMEWNYITKDGYDVQKGKGREQAIMLGDTLLLRCFYNVTTIDTGKYPVLTFITAYKRLEHYSEVTPSFDERLIYFYHTTTEEETALPGDLCGNERCELKVECKSDWCKVDLYLYKVSYTDQAKYWCHLGETQKHNETHRSNELFIQVIENSVRLEAVHLKDGWERVTQNVCGVHYPNGFDFLRCVVTPDDGDYSFAFRAVPNTTLDLNKAVTLAETSGSVIDKEDSVRRAMTLQANDVLVYFSTIRCEHGPSYCNTWDKAFARDRAGRPRADFPVWLMTVVIGTCLV